MKGKKMMKLAGKASMPHEHAPSHLKPMSGKDAMAHSTHHQNHQTPNGPMGFGGGMAPAIDDHCQGEQDPSACMTD